MKKLPLFLILGLLIFNFTFADATSETKLPKDRIQDSQIYRYQGGVLIEVENPIITYYENTNSMIPFLDEGANGIEIIVPIEDIAEGDILNFKSDNKVISHRVVKIGKDNQGWYAITQGDSNFISEKVRKNQVVSILVGVIY